jgi:hypothetical protein
MVYTILHSHMKFVKMCVCKNNIYKHTFYNPLSRLLFLCQGGGGGGCVCVDE